MEDVRTILIGSGVLVAVIGGIVLLNDIPPRQYPAIIVWLVAVLIAHDVVIAGIVFGVAFAGRRVEGRMPHRSILVAQGALAVGGIMVLLVVPEIVKKAVGTANPSILPLDYGDNLAILLVALAVAATAAIGLHAVLDRQRRRP
ncbi:hypothetical protein ACPW96_15020 [Micromonospora sp. DT81.3]